MKCLSCRVVELEPSNTKIFNHVVLCGPCHALAEKAEREIRANLHRAEQFAMTWLEQHILQGGLLRGGDGYGGQLLPASEVPGLRNAEADLDSGVPVAPGKPSSR